MVERFKSKRFMAFLLAAFLIFNVNVDFQNSLGIYLGNTIRSATGSKTVTFSESTSQSQQQTITIDNLNSIESKLYDTC